LHTPPSPLFPYTTLFRSRKCMVRGQQFAERPIIVDLTFEKQLCLLFERRAQTVIEVGKDLNIWPDRPHIAKIEPLAREVTDQCLDRKSTRLNSSHVSISY